VPVDRPWNEDVSLAGESSTGNDSPQGCLSIALFLNQRGVETLILAVDAFVEDPVEGEPRGPHRIKPFIEEAMARCDVRGIGIAFNYPGTGPFHDPASYDLEILFYDWSRYHLLRFDKPVSQLKAFAFSDIHASYQLLEATRRFAPQKCGGRVFV
jgi:hypothetical protein